MIKADRKVRKVQVKVVLTIEVDRDGYNDRYHENASVEEIREYVRAAAFSAVQSELSGDMQVYDGPTEDGTGARYHHEDLYKVDTYR